MRALHPEDVAGRLTRSRQLPAAAVGELEARAGIGSAPCPNVPLIGHRYLLGEIHCHRPAAQRAGAGIGDGDVHLEKSTPRVGGRGRAAMCRECLIAQHKAGQQHS